jgi:UMF1 family MFS transporter
VNHISLALGIPFMGPDPSLFAALGALLGGAVDRRLGSRRTLIGALSLAAVTLCLMLSFDAGRMLFFWEPQAAGTSSVFATLPERVFLSCAAIFGALAGAVIATSRTLMAHLAPEDSLAEFFGLYASVGQATGFVAPLLVGALTAWSGSQRIGLSIAIPLIAAGAVMLVFVGDRRTSGEHRPRSAVAS